MTQPQVQAQAAVAVTCSNCGAQVAAGKKFCADCGTPVQQYFRECPTCQQVVCISDFDAVSGYCNDDTPRRQEIAQAQAEQAAGFVKGVASIFGVTDAIKDAGQQMAQAHAQVQAGLATCAKCGNRAVAGTKFCDNCGGPMTQPQPQAAVAVTCSNCGAQVPAGKKFCADCGTPVQQ